MSFLKLNFLSQHLSELVLAGVTSSVFLVPSVLATEPIQSDFSSMIPTASSTTLSNSIKLPNQRLYLTKNVGCPDNQTKYVQAETQNFFISICGDNYIGVAKNGSGNITLPLVKFKPNFFVAVSRGIYLYRLTNEELVVLKVYKNGSNQTLVQEKVLKWNTTPEYEQFLREYGH